MSSLQKGLIWLTIFGIAMAFLESAVVVYLRALYYPSGIYFPMPPVDLTVAITELGRELATIIMLVSLAFILGKTPLQRFGYFIFTFAIWDIFYYVFLKILINWPDSFFDWDILFLIPVVWVSPVICPIIASISMIILSMLLIIGIDRNRKGLINRVEWILLLTGSVIMLASFMIDNLKYIVAHKKEAGSIIIYEEGRKLLTSTNYIPGEFNWILFILGEIIILVAIFRTARIFFKLASEKKD